MDWRSSIIGFKNYLQLERSLSGNSIDAYVRDIEKFTQFLEVQNNNKSINDIKLQDLEEFIGWINELGMSARSQARVISGIKAFYKYLLLEDLVIDDPTQLIETPKLGEKLPIVLSYEEVQTLIDNIDLSKPEGERNKAMLETLYGCGLRVTELTTLKISNLNVNAGFSKVLGKGDKERLVPIGEQALKQIAIYRENIRSHLNIKPGNEDILFLNRRGAMLSRVMVFTIIKDLARKIGLKKNISPHTFRHSFASHLIEGGANLRAIQEMLGHESITTTEIYTHLDKEYLRDTILQYHPRS
ncbi:MAG: site-specific tyrosine recombinase XerD [Bacteroidia bacterium]|nr:site-specific tyrosine recombinase XerD [Bacteroidia bacterium]MBL4716358.1 site-specific tyrosine recombinase XerD [Bacteroidia bacterium]